MNSRITEYSSESNKKCVYTKVNLLEHKDNIEKKLNSIDGIERFYIEKHTIGIEIGQMFDWENDGITEKLQKYLSKKCGLEFE